MYRLKKQQRVQTNTFKLKTTWSAVTDHKNKTHITPLFSFTQKFCEMTMKILPIMNLIMMYSIEIRYMQRLAWDCRAALM